MSILLYFFKKLYLCSADSVHRCLRKEGEESPSNIEHRAS